MAMGLPTLFMVFAGVYWACGFDEPAGEAAALGQFIGGALIISGLATAVLGLGAQNIL